MHIKVEGTSKIAQGEKRWTIGTGFAYREKVCPACEGTNRVLGKDGKEYHCPANNCYRGVVHLGTVYPYKVGKEVSIDVNAVVLKGELVFTYSSDKWTKHDIKHLFKTKAEARAFVAKRNQAKCRGGDGIKKEK